MEQGRTFDEYICQLAPAIPPALIGENAFSRIQHTAKLLPAAVLMNTFGFECPLGNDDSSADLLVSFQNKNNGAALLRRTALQNLHRHSLWKEVLLLADTWAQEQLLDWFWLEFDIMGDLPDVPSLFFKPLYGDLARLEYILTHTLGSLTGNGDVGHIKEKVLYIAKQLPDKATIFQVGAMRSRPVSGVRLCISEISLDAILRFLETVGYPGSIEDIKELLVFIQPFAHNVAFNIDVEDNLQAKVGFECYAGISQDISARAADWEKMLFRMRDKYIINMQKMNALAGFGAQYSSGSMFPALPDELAFAKALMNNHARSMIHQYLHHVKITYTPGLPLQVKAYLAIQHCWHVNGVVV